MIKAVIIDDEESNVELVTNLVVAYAPQLELAGSAGSVEDGCRLVKDTKPGLIFLDVQMGDGTGFDLLKRLGPMDFKVIFVTAHQEFAVEAFHFSALDYLLKPISPPALLASIHKAEQAIVNDEFRLKIDTLLANMNETSKKKRRIVLKTMERIYAIGSDEIVRFESDGSYTTVHLADGKQIVVSRLLKEFEDLLHDAGFLRVHQSHLVNMDFLYYFEKSDSTIILRDRSSIPVSARKKDQLMKFIRID
jgi:two-component system, LytTR family, response regulator